MGDRPDHRDVRISIRTTYGTKRRIAKAAAHHGLSISKYMKLCVVEHMRHHNLFDLPGRVNLQTPGTEWRPRLSNIREVDDPDEQDGKRFL